MKKTLYLKFVLAYAIFGIFGFAIVTAFVPNMYVIHKIALFIYLLLFIKL